VPVIRTASGTAEEWPVPGLSRPRRQRHRRRPGAGDRCDDLRRPAL